MTDSFLKAAPVLLGVVLGMLLYYSVLPTEGEFAMLVLLGIVGGVFYDQARRKVDDSPQAAVILAYLGLTLPIAIIGFMGWASALAADKLPEQLLKLPDWLVDKETVKKEVGDISKVLLGALGTFFSATLLKDADQHDNRFWPSGFLKRQIKSEHAELHLKLLPKHPDLSEDVLWAVTEDELRTSGRGWGFLALRERAAIIANGLAAVEAQKATQPPGQK